MQSERTQRGAGAALLAAVIALTISACGGSSAPASGSHPTSGKQIFTSVGCSGCHTLSAAGSSGTVGPNLDNLKPSYSAVVAQVTDGGGGMPSFGGSLSKTQIQAVAKFVSSATH